MAAATENLELARALRGIAERFGAGWHEGVEIEVTDLRHLSAAADLLEGSMVENSDRLFTSEDFCSVKF